ncbi:MAG: hypothetical protein HYX56_06340 [Chloroflexi bacterium]|nr:hypothetical protein [Chloroflexota bacterium]
MPLRKIARVFETAGKDADIARRESQSKEFRKNVAADRRGTLSEFSAVRDALKDRDRINATKKAKVIKAKRKR